MSLDESGDHGSLAARFGRLFDGRHGAYGFSTPSGVKCERPENGDHEHWMNNHLQGTYDVGVYPMVPVGPSIYLGDTKPIAEWRVKWVCVDLDIAAPGKRCYDFDSTEEAVEAAKKLISVAARYGVALWPEITKSGGIHVWGFLQNWTPADVARRAMLFLCDESGCPSTEVNPKQESLPSADSLGNFVRLVYPGALSA